MTKARTLGNVVSTGAVLADGTIDAAEIGNLTLPTGGDIVGTTSTQTLSNKTLTAPILGTPASGTLTNATGLPLSTGVTGTLPIANGGTGTTSTTFVNAATNVTGTLPIANGGTGQTLLSAVSVGTATNIAGGSNGTIPYQSAAGTTQMLAAGSAGQLLQTNGAGAPTWVTVAAPSTAGGATVTNPMSASITLTSSSNRVQVLTPSAQDYTITLPDATTISAAGGPIFVLQNTVPQHPIAVMDSAGTNVGWVVADYESNVYLTSTASATGNWIIKTGDAAADGGVYLYDASYAPITDSYTLGRSYGIGLTKNLFVALSGSGASNYAMNTFVSTTASSNSSGGQTNTNNTQTISNTYSACALSPTKFFNIYQGTGTSRHYVYVTSVNSSGGATKGTELDIGGANNAGSPVCVAIDDTKVLVYYNGPNGSNFAVAALITISGTTCTLASYLGSSFNEVGASIGVNASIAVLSSTRFHFAASQIYSVELSGTTLSLLGSATPPNGVRGIVPVSATTSMVFGTSGGKVVANIATDSSGTITFGSTSDGFMPSTTSTLVSKINTGAAIVISGNDGGTNKFGERYFAIVKSISGVPTLVSRGVLPATVSNPFYVHPQSGVAIYTLLTGDSTSNSTSSYQFKKMAITGAI